jgi:hypothetical protein
LFRLVAFWGRSAMGWPVPFSLGEFLVEGPLLAYVVEKLVWKKPVLGGFD